MNPTTTLVVGVSVLVFVVLSWLGGILYLRRRRLTMQSEPTAATGAALLRTSGDVWTIEDWLARAATLPNGSEPTAASPDSERDQDRLHAFAAKHFPHIVDRYPHLHLIGITGVEKRLVTWVCDRTGLPNPFDVLERVIGDPDEMRRACDAWTDAHREVAEVVDRLCVATADLHERWTGDPEADKFFAVLADYLGEMDALAADLAATKDALRGLQAEAALAEGTIVGLINLLIGSLGGYVVEAVLTAGTMTPAVAAQAQLELTWVLKQIARALSKLPALYANARHILQSVTGFKGLDQMRERFQLAEVTKIEQSVDAAL
jgi:hypothetical protein